MSTIQTGQFRNGMKILLDGDPWNVVETEFVKPGKGQAFVRARVKNLSTGRVVERTFKSNETVEGADDLSVEYANADVAVCAFGVTAYELAACGIPAVYLGLTPDHVLSASAFADAGMGLNLGLADKVSDADIVRFLQWLLNKPAARRDMRKQGMALLDGQGASRIAADLASALAAARAPISA